MELDQVTCDKCKSTYHRKIKKDVFYWENICELCLPKKAVKTFTIAEIKSPLDITEKKPQYLIIAVGFADHGNRYDEYHYRYGNLILTSLSPKFQPSAQ